MSVVLKSRAKPQTASKSRGSGDSLIPASPQVNLLPAEISYGRSLKRLKKYLAYGLVGLVLAIGILVVATKLAHQSAEESLRAEQGRTDSLLLEQRRFAPVTVVKERLSLTHQALDYISRTDIDWSSLLDQISGATSKEVRITELAGATDTPLEVAAITESPLYPANVGLVTLTGTSETRPDTTTWARSLDAIPAVADVWINVVAAADGDPEAEFFEIEVTLVIDPAAQRADGRIANLPSAEETD